MAAPLVERSTGDVIPAYDHNDVKDYIEDGTYRVNTLSLSIGGTEAIDSSGTISVPIGQKLVLDSTGGNSYFVYNNSSNKVELFVDGNKKADWG